MKALNILELDSLAESLEAFGGAELQSVVVSKREFALRFHTGSESFWLILDLNAQTPVVVLLESLPVKLEKSKSPLGLFFEAHFVGQRLLACHRQKQYGRVLEFEFSNEKSMQLRLFPHGQNLLLSSEGKSMSFQKPSELEVMSEEFEPEEVRSISEVAKQWLAKRTKIEPGKKGSRPDSEARQQKVKKLAKSLKRLEADIESKQNTPWRSAGEWLAARQSLEGAPEDLAPCFDLDQSFAWNLENCFARAKKNESKLETVLERKSELAKELSELEAMSDEQFTELAKVQSKKPRFQLQTKQPVKTRKLELGSGATVFVGKSAKDNLQLLRKARAWDYWFHIKDLPSAHALLFRNKGQKISEAEMTDVAKFLISTSKSSQSDSLLEQKVEVLVAEKRYVQPIKGDKHGRVTHRNAKTLVVGS
jgi:predicted ribosome quality control (RQC) complex YloA/Tae2 family protein